MTTTDPPAGLIPVQVKGAVLLFSPQEYLNGIRRGKSWRRRVAMQKREAERNNKPQEARP